MRWVFLPLFFLLCSFTTTLRDKFKQAEVGDYVVTEQGKNYSLLCVHALSETTLVLEEITAPASLLDPSKISWQEWIDAKAPGHTAWNLYEIDLEKGALIGCYSVARQGWLRLDDSELFLPKLLALPLEPTPVAERKKIGPPPQGGEEDRRALWLPPVVIEGKKKNKPPVEVLHSRWPKDNTLMSECAVEFYFSPLLAHFPFPHWIEISSPHYTLKVRTLDSGKGVMNKFSPFSREAVSE